MVYVTLHSGYVSARQSTCPAPQAQQDQQCPSPQLTEAISRECPYGAPGAAGVGTGISRFNQGAARPGAFRVSTCPRGCALLRHLHGRSPHSRGSASLRSPHFGICTPLGCACCLQPSHAAPQHVHPSVWPCPPQQAPSLHGHTPRQVHGLAGTRHCRCHQ